MNEHAKKTGSLPIFCLAWMLLVQLGLAGQDPRESAEPEQLTFSIDTQLVQIYLTVNQGDRRVTDLRLTDFTLMEDGKPQKIERLDAGTVPLHVALLLDTSESMRDALPAVQQAATFFVQSLQPGDRVALITFSSDLHCVPQLTEDRSPILNAIRSTQPRGSTRLYDALLYAMKYLAAKEGRKAIVSFSDGEDTARSSSLNVVLNAAERYGFPVYAIGAGSSLTRDPLKRVLRALADVNSGQMYFVDDPRDLRDTFAQVLDELRSAYVLSYYTRVPFDGRWHDLKVGTSNPKDAVNARKGFFARPGSGGDPLSGLTSAERKAPILDLDHSVSRPLRDPNARRALEELVQTTPAPREMNARALAAALSAPNVPGTQPGRQERPTFKVESRFVEVPVLVESAPGKSAPELGQKDFRVYEDGSLREIAIFRKGVRSEDLTQLRETVLAGAQPGTTASFADPQELILGRYYLVLDDLASDAISYMRAREAASQIVREYHSPVRPMSLHFASSASADISAVESLEKMLDRLKQTGFKGDNDLTSNDGIMSVYEAYLIERGDRDARQLAELRYAASIMVEFENDLGEVDGQNTTRPEMIEMTVQDTARSLLTRNFAQMSRTIDGLRAVVNAAAADPGNHPKSILFLSSGFSVGRNSMRGDTSTMLDSLIAAAKRKGIKIFTVNAAGLEVQEALGIGASGAFLVRNPHLQSLLESHALGWRLDREGTLFQLAKETGGRFIHSNNDLTAASAEALRSAGQLYYLGFMSRQPVDGRFHNIRVVTSAPVKVTARKGFYAGLSSSKVPAELENEDWNVVLVTAEQARKTGDIEGFAGALEKLVQKFPNQANFWYNLGSAQMALNRPEAAADSFQKCFALSPDDKAAGAALSRSLAAAGFRSAAAQTLELVVQKHPRDLDVLVQLGRVYETDSRTGDAYQAYRRILDITLNPPLDVYVLLTRTSMRLGRDVEAELFIHDFLERGGPESSIDPWRQELTAARR